MNSPVIRPCPYPRPLLPVDAGRRPVFPVAQRYKDGLSGYAPIEEQIPYN